MVSASPDTTKAAVLPTAAAIAGGPVCVETTAAGSADPAGNGVPHGVERPVTIAVTGAHSTGKSTFLARLAGLLREDGLEVATVADLGEQAQRIGLPILYSHTYASTLWIMTRGISNEIATWPHVDVLLVDRPVPDALGYYLAALDHRREQPEPALLARLRAIAALHADAYDLIFRTLLDETRPLGTDRARDRNGPYRRLVDHHIAAVMADLNLGHVPLAVGSHDNALRMAAAFAAEHVQLRGE